MPRAIVVVSSKETDRTNGSIFSLFGKHDHRLAASNCTSTSFRLTEPESSFFGRNNNMSKHTPPGGAVKGALGAGALLAAAWAATRVVNHVSTGKLDSYTNDPVRDYDSALARFAQVQAGEEKADQAINPVCHSKLLAHGHKVERAIVIMHGMTNCPRQFIELAPLFFERGYNVLIPRMPHSGLAYLDTDALKYVTATELRDCSNTFVDMARGLGNHVTYVGISVGGLMGAWVAQYRTGVNKAIRSA